MSIFWPVFSRVHAAAQVKNTCVSLAENLKTESREDKLIKGTQIDPRFDAYFVCVNFCHSCIYSGC